MRVAKLCMVALDRETTLKVGGKEPSRRGDRRLKGHLPTDCVLRREWQKGVRPDVMKLDVCITIWQQGMDEDLMMPELCKSDRAISKGTFSMRSGRAAA